MKKFSALRALIALLFLCVSAQASVTITATLCSSGRATVTLERHSSTGAVVSTYTSSYTNGDFSAALENGSDGSRYKVTITCAATGVTSTEYWLIPGVAGPLVSSKVSVASTVSIALGAYWDNATETWKNTASGISGGGEGTGDVVGPSSSVDSEVALFNSTTGKLIKRASITGLGKFTSGVLSAAVSGTDYGAPDTALGVTETSDTVITLAAGTFRLGGIPHSVASCTWTLSGTSATSNYAVYLNTEAKPTFIHTGTATATGSGVCLVVTGATTTPEGGTELATGTYTSNNFAAPNDKRPRIERELLADGEGIAHTTNGDGLRTTKVDPALIPRYYTQAGAPSGGCTTGRDFSINTSNGDLYKCNDSAWVVQGGNSKLQVEWAIGPVAGITAGGTTTSNGIACDNPDGCTPSLLTAGNRQLLTVAYTNTGGTTAGTFYHKLPSNWDAGTVSFNVTWSRSGGAGTGSNAVLQLETACVANTESIVGTSYNTAQTVTTAKPASAGDQATSSIASVTMTGCVAGEILIGRLSRLSGHASDDMAADLHVYDGQLIYKANLTN